MASHIRLPNGFWVSVDFDAREVTITTPIHLVCNKKATNRGTSESIPRKNLNVSA